MGKIPEEEIERIKREVDLVALIRSKGVELKRHGSRDLVGLSPFTDEKTPSFVVTPGKNLWHCMSSGKGGSVVDFVMEHEKLGFRHAFELLNENHGEFLLRPRKHGDGTQDRRLPSPVSLDSDDQTLIDETLSYYQERLKQSAVALDYLSKRGLHDEEALATFRIGLSDRTLGIRLPHANGEAGITMRNRLKKAGILRAKTGHEHFNGCIVFPVAGLDGSVTEIYGRRFGRQKSKVYHLYLPGPHVGIWNPKCFENREIILTESIVDALTFWINGFKNVTCIYGTEGFTDELFQAFIDNKTQIVRFAYDNDKAGNRALERDVERLCSVGIDCYRIKFPVGMDVNEYAQQVKPAQRSLRMLVQSAEWMSKGARPQNDSTNNNISLAANTVSCSEGSKLSEPSQSVNSVSSKDPAAKDKKMDTNDPASSFTVKEMPGGDYLFTIGDRHYRVRGLAKNTSLEILKINLRLLCGEFFYLDDLNLYLAKHREQFIQRGAAECNLRPELVKRDLGKLLLSLEQLQEKRLQEALTPKAPEHEIADAERKEALELLKSPNLVERILGDFERSGIVGERVNKLVGYLGTVSRKLDKPLAVIVQSTSAAGKTTLMESILSFLPEEDCVKYSAMTGQSLYYLGETELKHKVLAIVEEEGAERASYALKLLQSEGELTIASTGKDATTGRMQTEEYHVEGPVMIFLTTTAIDIDEELMNRCIVLTVDEGKAQTEAIHRLQRQSRKLEGLKRKHARKNILKMHRNAHRLLRPCNIVNPYADFLTFRSDRTRTRRDHEKYLTLIDTITLLHQYQRPVKEHESIQYIEVTLEDIAMANRFAHEVLGRSLDELPPQTRKVLEHLCDMVSKVCHETKVQRQDHRFTRRQVREFTGLSDTQLRLHLSRLVELEYLVSYYSASTRGFVYELCYDGPSDSKPYLMGLMDTKKLKQKYDAYLAELKAQVAGSKDQSAGDARSENREIKGSNEAA